MIHEVDDARIKAVTAYADGLRQIADFFEKNPHLPLPDASIQVGGNGIDDKDAVAAFAKALGTCKKRYSATCFALSKYFGVVELETLSYRDAVCKRIVTTEEVEEQVPLTFETRTVTKETVSWECPDALLA